MKHDDSRCFANSLTGHQSASADDNAHHDITFHLICVMHDRHPCQCPFYIYGASLKRTFLVDTTTCPQQQVCADNFHPPRHASVLYLTSCHGVFPPILQPLPRREDYIPVSKGFVELFDEHFVRPRHYCLSLCIRKRGPDHRHDRAGTR